VAASFRFHGERLPKKGSTFTRCLWGHFFRKFSTHPSFLVSISKNWVVATGLSTDVTNPYLPIDLATAAWRQQSMFPALKFRTQYLYTSADYARHAWKEDHFIPMMRLFPLLGQNVAEDLAACILVDGFWAKLALQPSDTVHDESFWGSVAEFVDEMTALREHDGFAVKVSDFFHLAMPSLETTKKNQQEAPAATAP
jgi:hypothetical protein